MTLTVLGCCVEVWRPAAAAIGGSLLQAAGATFYSNATSPLNRLFLQLVIIIAACSIAGRLFRRIRQPAVVGEMIAGILLGPSLFGLLAPGGFQFVFATAALEPVSG